MTNPQTSELVEAVARAMQEAFYRDGEQVNRWSNAAIAAITATRANEPLPPNYYDAADEIMHFINALDSAEMDGNAVRSAIYHKCLEMKPQSRASDPLVEQLAEALEELHGETLYFLGKQGKEPATSGRGKVLFDKVEAALTAAKERGK